MATKGTLLGMYIIGAECGAVTLHPLQAGVTMDIEVGPSEPGRTVVAEETTVVAEGVTDVVAGRPVVPEGVATFGCA